MGGRSMTLGNDQWQRFKFMEEGARTCFFSDRASLVEAAYQDLNSDCHWLRLDDDLANVDPGNAVLAQDDDEMQVDAAEPGAVQALREKLEYDLMPSLRERMGSAGSKMNQSGQIVMADPRFDMTEGDVDRALGECGLSLRMGLMTDLSSLGTSDTGGEVRSYFDRPPTTHEMAGEHIMRVEIRRQETNLFALLNGMYSLAFPPTDYLGAFDVFTSRVQATTWHGWPFEAELTLPRE